MKYFSIIALVMMILSCGRNKEVIVAYQDRIGDGPLILMANQDSTEDSGFKWMQFSSGPETAEALLTGSAHIASMGDTAALQILCRYPGKFLLIGSHASGESRHRIVVSRTEGSEWEIGDLDGKRIALKKGTSTHGGFLMMCEQLGINPDQKILDLKPGLQLNALSAGEVDIIIASEPTPSIAEEKGYGRVMAPIDVEGMHFPIVLLAEKSWALKHRDLIDHFIEDLEKTYKGLYKPENINYLIETTSLEKETLQASMEMHQYRYLSPLDLKEELDRLYRVLSSQGYYKSSPDWDVSLYHR